MRKSPPVLYITSSPASKDGATRQSAAAQRDAPQRPGYPVREISIDRDVLSVRDRDGRHVYWATAPQAVELLRAKKADPVLFGKRVRFICLRDPRRIADYETSSGERHTRYSHDREVLETYVGDDGQLKRRHPLDANVRGCWTLKRIPSSLHSIFTTVVDEVIPRAA